MSRSTDRVPTVAGLAVLAVLLALLYGKIVASLASDWLQDPDYSHGFLVAPLAVWFAWRRRPEWVGLEPSCSLLGGLALGASLLVLLVGTLGAEFFLQRLSLVLVLASLVWYTLGWAFLRVLALPLAFLLLMIPPPALVINALSLPLQLMAASSATYCLQGVGVPVLREGNVIALADTTLEVAEACNGIRSLQALATLAVVYGQWSQDRAWKRWALLVAAVPIAIVANAIRVAGTGLLAHAYGPAVAQGFYHSFAGLIVFLAALALLVGTSWLISRASRRGAVPAEAA